MEGSRRSLRLRQEKSRSEHEFRNGSSFSSSQGGIDFSDGPILSHLRRRWWGEVLAREARDVEACRPYRSTGRIGVGRKSNRPRSTLPALPEIQMLAQVGWIYKLRGQGAPLPIMRSHTEGCVVDEEIPVIGENHRAERDVEGYQRIVGGENLKEP